MIRSKKIDFILMLPCIIFLVIMIAYPLVFALRSSFTSWDQIKPENLHFIGFKNYIKVFTDPDFTIIAKNTLIFVAGTVSMQLFFGIVLAYVLKLCNSVARNIFTTILLVPMVISPVATGIIWRTMYEPNVGTINTILHMVGFTEIPLWLADPKLAMFSIVTADAWQWTPFVVLLVSTGLQNIPEEVEEAAKLDGASDIKIFLKILIPLITPIILIVLLIRTMEAFKIFDIVYMTTFGGPGTTTLIASLKIYKLGLRSFKIGEASAFSYILNITIFIISYIYLRFLQRSYY